MVSPELKSAIDNFCRTVNEPYEMEQDVWQEEAEYIDRTYIPEAIARNEETRHAVLTALVNSVQFNRDHGKIRHWSRAAMGVARYLLLPTDIQEVNLAYAGDVVVRISGWHYTHNNFWKRFLPTANCVVKQLWGDIDRFRDEDDQHILQLPGIKD